MMLKLTSVCSMGCAHCISDCKSTGIHMTWDVLVRAVEYIKRNNSLFLVVSGGEPTEHPNFFNMIIYIMDQMNMLSAVTVTTNGDKLHGKFADELLKIENTYNNLFIQVTNVKKYYPKDIDTTHSIFNHENTALCREIEYMYPQGRAVNNNIPWKSKGSKCINTRIIPKQMYLNGTMPTMKDVTDQMAVRYLSCTPFIDPEGNIKLGESDLCPTCATIYQSDKEIMRNVLHFQCNRCKFINDKVLPPIVRQLLEL